MVTIAACPRCLTRLIQTFEEPKCLACGYRDWSGETYEDRRRREQRGSAAQRGYKIPYMGGMTLRRRLKVRIYVAPRSGIYSPACPYCKERMVNSGDGSKTWSWFVCGTGHKIRLLRGMDGIVEGWSD